MLTIAFKSSVKNVFIRGSVVRYVHLPASAVDVPLLEDATRRGSCYFALSPLCSFPPLLFIPMLIFHYHVPQHTSSLFVCIPFLTNIANSSTEAANQAGKGK